MSPATKRDRCPRCGGSWVAVPEGQQCLACGHVRYAPGFAPGHDPLVPPTRRGAAYRKRDRPQGIVTRDDAGTERHTRGGPADEGGPA